MALETLIDVEEIDGFEVVVMDKLREKYPEKFNESSGMDWKWFEKEIRPNKFIYLRHDKNSISFTLQNGPIKENGINGCQVDTLLETALIIIENLNDKIPCVENIRAIVNIKSAISQLKDRKEQREKRGVEGTSKR